MHYVTHRNKILEQMQLGNMSLKACIDFLQQQELTEQFQKPNNRPYYLEVVDIHAEENIYKMPVLRI